MLLCENKALVTGVLASWVNVVEGAVWDDRGEAYTCSSSDQGGSMRPIDGSVTLYPHRKKKKKTEPKQVSLLSHWRLWSTAHLLLQSKPVDPSARMELHLYKHSEGGMCEQCHKRILFSKRGVDLANEWFMWLRIWVWWSDVKLGKWSLFYNVNTNGVTCVFVFTDVM